MFSTLKDNLDLSIPLIFFCILFGLFISDMLFSTPIQGTGTVIDKHYSAAKTQTGSGVGVTSNGDVGFVTTSSSEPEKFILMVRAENGQVLTVECEPELYYAKEKDDRIDFTAYHGALTDRLLFVVGEN